MLAINFVNQLKVADIVRYTSSATTRWWLYEVFEITLDGPKAHLIARENNNNLPDNRIVIFDRWWLFYGTMLVVNRDA